MKKRLETEVADDALFIIEHTEFEGDVFVIVEKEEMEPLINSMKKEWIMPKKKYSSYGLGSHRKTASRNIIPLWD